MADGRVELEGVAGAQVAAAVVNARNIATRKVQNLKKKKKQLGSIKIILVSNYVLVPPDLLPFNFVWLGMYTLSLADISLHNKA